VRSHAGDRSLSRLFGASIFLALIVVLVQPGRSSPLRGSTAGPISSIRPPPNDQIFPAVASDGKGYLVVWTDSRTVDPDGHFRFQIYGTRVTERGVVLDPGGFLIGTTRAPSTAGVTFDGRNYFVVWSQQTSISDYDIYGARVSPAGKVLDPAGLPIAFAPGEKHDPAVAYGHGEYFVTWQDPRSGTQNEIYGARVTLAGNTLDPEGFRISATPVCSGVFRPSVAFDGSSFVVGWSDHRNGRDCDAYVAHVSASGSVVEPTGIPVGSTSAGEGWPRLAFAGADQLAIWDQGAYPGFFAVYGRRLSGGAPIGPAFPISAPEAYEEAPAIAFTGSNFLVVWERYPPNQIYGAVVGKDGTVLRGAAPVSRAAGEQEEPQIASASRNALAVWMDSRLGGSHVFGTRLSPAGRALDGDGFLISQDASAACRVPRVIGMRVSAARSRIRRAQCSVGGVRRKPSARKARVIGQAPSPGKTKRPYRFGVRLTIGG
jgi:hypothetical protein